MYLNYFPENAELTASSFGWNYSFIYLRGTIPLIVLMNIFDSTYYNEPVVLIFILCLITDYIILFVLSYINKLKYGSSNKNKV